MAWIEFNPTLRTEIARRYRQWALGQPRQANQIGEASWSSVTGPHGELQLPDAFVDELECLGVAFTRR